MSISENADGWDLFPAMPSSDFVGLVYGLVLVWGLGDILSTYFAYAASGSGHMEANPWIAIMLDIDPLLVIVLKAGVVLYAAVVLLECQPIVQRVPWWRGWLSGLVLVGVLVVVNNLLVGIVALT